MKQTKREKAIKFHTNLSEEKMKKYGHRKTCKGGKPHDFLLTIPSYLTFIEKITPKIIEGYYKLQEEEHKFNTEMEEKYKKLGIERSRYFNGRAVKYYICSVCGKRDYK